jgi:hypothetical protein
MLTVITFLQAIMVAGTIVCVTYCLMHVSAYCVLWLIEKLSFKPRDHRHQHWDKTPLRTLSNPPRTWLRA